MSNRGKGEGKGEGERIYGIARGAVAFVWIWHGLVPKILVRDPVEVAPMLPLGIDETDAWTLVLVAGVAEILFGILMLLLWRARWPLTLTVVAMSGLLIGVIFTEPSLAGGAFNPVTLNVGVIALAVIALIAGRERVESEYHRGKG